MLQLRCRTDPISNLQSREQLMQATNHIKILDKAWVDMQFFSMMLPSLKKSKVQQCVTLSITEAESISGADCAQDMLFAMRVLESMGLRIKKPMTLFIDNKGAVDHANNWTTGGRMRHASVRLHFLRELKELGLINTEWCKGRYMPADLFTKNLSGPLFNIHTTVICEKDEYNK
jgi:hypothetical protein